MGRYETLVQLALSCGAGVPPCWNLTWAKITKLGEPTAVFAGLSGFGGRGFAH
jgi:hypothetical protein